MFDVLPASFCPKDDCDYGHLAVNHAGNVLVFECRIPIEEEPPLLQTWNLCIANLDAEGKAHAPRLLLPPYLRQDGRTFARATPFGLLKANGEPLEGVYDKHFRTRQAGDANPVFGPADDWLYFSSMGPEPLSGDRAFQTYHGFEPLDHIVAVHLTEDLLVDAVRTIYVNEGGVANFPTLLPNGRIGFHTWNLERIDRHLYQQIDADGSGDLPVLFGRLQGPSMWGKFTALNDGRLLGITGRRRGQLDTYVPFVADHTLGLGLGTGPQSFGLFDEEALSDMAELGFCATPPDGPNCHVRRYYEDASWWPDGRAVIAYAPSGVYTNNGEEMFKAYASGNTLEEKLASLAPYLPQDLGLALIDGNGQTTILLTPSPGHMLRYPTWIGPRAAPLSKPLSSAIPSGPAELHIADVRTWLSFQYPGNGERKDTLLNVLDTITAVRVLIKPLPGNACLSDDLGYRLAVNDGNYDHPTHLGINNATGYWQKVLPTNEGGTAFGDAPLMPDGSVRLRVPSGVPLLLQGIDAEGFVVSQRGRVFALPPGSFTNTGVRRNQYGSQCASCHGAIDGGSYPELGETPNSGTLNLDFSTLAAASPPVDFSIAPARPLTFLSAIRPLLDAHCTGCHGGTSPAAELSLTAPYSADGNYPKGRWAQLPFANPAYLSAVPEMARVPAYNWSVDANWYFTGAYRNEAPYSAAIVKHSPLGPLAPWDSGYQNLHAKTSQGNLYYLNSQLTPGHFGRSDELGGTARGSYLLEVLTGENRDPDRDYSGPSHQGLLAPSELSLLKAVLDVGFPYADRCDARIIPSGPNSGLPWGDPEPQVLTSP